LILDLLADGAINMTTIRLLNPHLTSDNWRSLMAEAAGAFCANACGRSTIVRPATGDNISLRCRDHNAFEAELLFGRYEPPARDGASAREWVSFEAAETCSGTRFA